MKPLAPMLAEIGDKMPTLGELRGFWLFLGCMVAAATARASLRRLSSGGAFVFLSACLAVAAAWPDSTMDPLIVEELGRQYLLQQRMAGLIPFGLTLLVWVIVAWIRSRREGDTIHRGGADSGTFRVIGSENGSTNGPPSSTRQLQNYL